ncbi:uncharacterized protein LOC128735014 [Sabethes cyaneus]|uniref:uncharacterized protein LOC128735014 n=1 Tax=Sabethes cyaneus TaxID=53552 RepID=UPI00237E0263|nr:uncharacterized protein LOC128735014 [Sabethes cyaneus]
MTSSCTNKPEISIFPGSDLPYAMLSNKQSKSQDSDIRINEPQSNKGSVIKGFSIMGNVLQKMTKMAKILIPAELQLDSLEKNKRLLFVPDIAVDSNISTPVFDTTPGKAKLSIPEQHDRSAFLENTLGSEHIINASRNVNESNILKRMDQHTHGKGFSATNQKTRKRQMRYKMGIKNHHEKNRHNLQVDMLEDYRHDANYSDQDSDTEFNDAIQHVNFEVQHTIGSIITNESASACSLFNATIPAFEYSVYNVVCNLPRTQSNDQISECGSDDSFVIFSDDVQHTTPSASSTRQKPICATINNIFSAASFRRQRQISECSDDSIVFCYDSDYEDINCKVTKDTASKDDQDTENESCCRTSNSDLSQQLDSGFEEKKVRFNLKPEVHVIRVWDFAYRQARKGEWETAARDRERFRKRIEETEPILKPVFDRCVRETVFRARFSS